MTDVTWTQTISARKDLKKSKESAITRSDCYTEQEWKDYQLVSVGRMSMKQNPQGEWTIYAGATPVETHETEEACTERYDYLFNNKIAVGMVSGNAYKRENIGGFTGGAAYSGWTRT